MKKETLNKVELIIFELIENCDKRITQRQIALSEKLLGCHPIYESNINLPNPNESTLRKVRQVIRDLRLNHNAPILSDVKGYFIPQDQNEIDEYLNRIEKMAKAQAISWRETYQHMKNTFEVESDYFENNFGQLDMFED